MLILLAQNKGDKMKLNFLDFLNLNNVGKDKLLHYIIGSVLGLFGFINIWIGVAAVLLFAIGKEIRDSRGYGTPEVMDAVATILGGAFTLALIVL